MPSSSRQGLTIVGRRGARVKDIASASGVLDPDPTPPVERFRLAGKKSRGIENPTKRQRPELQTDSRHRLEDVRRVNEFLQPSTYPG